MPRHPSRTASSTATRHRSTWLVAVGLLVLSACSGSSTTASNGATPANSAGAGSAKVTAGGAATKRPGHIFVVNLENKGYDETFGPDSKATYLTKTLAAKGQMLNQYFGIGHLSLPNYLAEISGQAPNPTTQADCPKYVEFNQTGTAAEGQATGEGCVYPAGVKTVADQLLEKGLSWKGYMEDIEQSTTGGAKTCRHATLGEADPTHVARKGDQYAARHDPFVYFHSIIDTPECDKRVVSLPTLEHDLGAVDTTPNYSLISPNLCNDGHDAPCVDGKPGGLVSADAWLSTWVPKILDSPAFKADGLLVITFDEAEIGETEAAASCCNEQSGPNVKQAGISGPGGGRTGAVLLSPLVNPGSTNATPYNHYALLCSIEEAFGLAKLGYAGQAGLTCFGPDVYAN